MREISAGVSAGAMIAIAGAANLSVGGFGGAFLFSIGLSMVCLFKMNLFTGKVSLLVRRASGMSAGSFSAHLVLMWILNLIGAETIALLLLVTRFGPELNERANVLVEARLQDSYLGLFVLGILCNVMIYMAVTAWSRERNAVGVFLNIMCVMVFVLSGYEHSVADMFYFSMSSIGIVRWLPIVLVVSLGNAVGGITAALLDDKKE